MNKQVATTNWISENLVEVGRLRHDVVSGKLQIREEPAKQLDPPQPLDPPRPSLQGREQDPARPLEPPQLLDPTQFLDPPQPSLQGRERGVRGAELGREESGVEWRDMSTEDINSIVCHCAAELDQSITSREVMTALHSHLVPDVHPLREWVKSCRPYDPERMPDFIEMLADQVQIAGGEQAQRLWRQCFKKWFVAMVASWLDDEVVNHQVLVLIGRQGIYKTTWLERLLPPCLRCYSTKLANTRDLNKDERLRVAECGLRNMDEIDSMSPRELNQLKS
ncbi:MAG: VapE domain-containing protein, partial [Paludibacteraceae bacterium]